MHSLVHVGPSAGKPANEMETKTSEKNIMTAAMVIKVLDGEMAEHPPSSVARSCRT